jgi:hypothetical protein
MLQMDSVEAHFKKKFDQTGVALTLNQLLAFAREKGLRGVTRAALSSFLRAQPALAQFAPARKTVGYQSQSVLRPGVFHIDFGEFHKKWAAANKGCTGFLVAVENFTNRLFVSPCKDKGTAEWFKAISQFVSLSLNVSVIYSDRDSVATSATFRDRLQRDYNVSWHFLKKGHKAFLAERYIGFVKTKLSQALLHKGGQNWVQFVEPLVTEYNAEKIAGTSYKRRSVTRQNFDHFLAQLLKTDQPELLFNGFKAGPFETDAWNRQIFKFDLGDKVLLARRANWKEAEQKLTAFTKVSSVGGFGPTVYTVSGRQLRSTKRFRDFVPCYSLAELGPSLHFYATELQRAPTSGL